MHSRHSDMPRRTDRRDGAGRRARLDARHLEVSQRPVLGRGRRRQAERGRGFGGRRRIRVGKRGRGLGGRRWIRVSKHVALRRRRLLHVLELERRVAAKGVVDALCAARSAAGADALLVIVVVARVPEEAVEEGLVSADGDAGYAEGELGDGKKGERECLC